MSTNACHGHDTVQFYITASLASYLSHVTSRRNSNARSPTASLGTVTFEHEYSSLAMPPTKMQTVGASPFAQCACTRVCSRHPHTHSHTRGIIYIRPVSSRSVYNCVRSKSNVKLLPTYSHTLSPPRLISIALNSCSCCFQQILFAF